MALQSLLLEETKRTTAVLAGADSSHGRGSCVLWMPPGGCSAGRGTDSYQNLMGTAKRGISRRARGNSCRSGRERWQAGQAVIPGAKTLAGLISPSVGKILSVGSSALLWGEGPELCPDSQRPGTQATAHLAGSEHGLWCQRELGANSNSSSY